MKYPEDFINKVICGAMPGATKNIPNESIDMCMTSPPYWGLRDYGVEQIFGESSSCEHEWDSYKSFFSKSGKGGKQDSNRGTLREDKFSQVCNCGAWKGQLGLEPTPELYIEHLNEIFHEVKRVLKKEGTLWLNIGDTYGGGSGGYYPHEGELGASKAYIKTSGAGKPKCLCMIPERLALSLIQDGWILRNKIIWYKPNAMPSSVTDRFSNRYEFIYMFSKQRKYYFDLDAVRAPHIWAELDKRSLLRRVPGKLGKITEGIYATDAVGYNPNGKNPGDVFEITTQPFPEAHFTVFPEKLCEKPIKAGCPEEVCKKCGKARERIVKEFDTGRFQKMPDNWDTDPGHHKAFHRKGREKGEQRIPVIVKKTIGWTSCDCKAGFEGGILLDPFCGAGTALYVAKEMKRNYIGIDIKEEFCKMSRKRTAQGVL